MVNFKKKRKKDVNNILLLSAIRAWRDVSLYQALSTVYKTQRCFLTKAPLDGFTLLCASLTIASFAPQTLELSHFVCPFTRVVCKFTGSTRSD